MIDVPGAFSSLDDGTLCALNNKMVISRLLGENWRIRTLFSSTFNVWESTVSLVCFYLRSKILTFSPLDGHTPLPMHKKMWWPYLGFFSSTFNVWESKVSYFFYSLRRGQDMCIFSPLRWYILQFMILAQLNPSLFLFSFFFFLFSPYAFLIQRLFEWKCV